MKERFLKVKQRLLKMKERFLKVKDRFLKMKERFLKMKDRFLKMKEHFLKVKDRFLKMKEHFLKVKDRFLKMNECFLKIKKSFRMIEDERTLVFYRTAILFFATFHFSPFVRIMTFGIRGRRITKHNEQMKTFFKTIFPLLLTVVLLTRCGGSEPKNFAYTYVLESTRTYRLFFSLDSLGHYVVEKQNIRFEQYEPYRAEGTLTDEEYARFKALLAKSKLFDMNNSYGFEKEPDQPVADMIYQIAYQADGREKFITIRHEESMRFSRHFTELLKYTNEFISDRVKE